MAEFLETVISQIDVPCEGVRIIELVSADGTPLPAFRAGAHVEVVIRPSLVRHYSLCNDPAERHRYRIGVLRDPGSQGGSKVICSQWVEGMRVRISSPRNLFSLDPSAPHSILIAGGIGLTPLLSMAHQLSHDRRSFELHYCVSGPDRAAFAEELKAAPFSEHVKVHYSSERRFSLEGLGGNSASDHIYVCGPQGFMDTTIDAAKALGWNEDRIHLERFDAEVDSGGEPFEVELSDGTLVHVPAGKSIANVLLEAGFEVEVSCQKGICGSCITEVRDGIPDHRDHYLTEAERKSNDLIALCCSRSLTPKISIDL